MIAVLYRHVEQQLDRHFSHPLSSSCKKIAIISCLPPTQGQLRVNLGLFFPSHRLVPLATLLPVEPDEAVPAVGLFRGLLEGAAVELLEAVGAHKVLRVELPVHGGDAPTLCVWESPSP